MNAAGSRRIALLAVVLSLLALPGTANHAAHAAGTPQPSVAALRICGGCAESGGNLSRYHYVILNSSDAALLPALKAQNPGLKALVYKSFSFTVSYGCSGGADLPQQTSGVGYCDANANHPDWFLNDTTGARINSGPFPQAWLMDVGNAGYQAKWLSNVLADVRAGGWDGVFMDDTDADLGFHLNGRTVAKYPTNAAWRTATRSMLANVGPALQSAGFLAVPNLYTPWATDYDAQATWRDWIGLTSGAAQEYYSKWGTNSAGWLAGSDWTYRQQFQAITEQAGKVFLGITYAPKSDARSMTWARTNFLLFDEPANGGALVYQFSDPESQDPYSPVWTADVGSPTGARFQVGAAWRRNFSGGTVLVNPTSSTVTVQLDKPYLQADGSTTSSVTLGATSGAVLRSSSTAPPPPPPPPPGPITLKASVAGTSVTLGWTGMTSANADVFRNGSRVATVSNTGAYLDRLPRKTKGTFSYRVCAAGTSTCSDTVSATVGQKVSPTFSSSLRAVHLAQRATRPLRALRARPARGRNGRSRAASR